MYLRSYLPDEYSHLFHFWDFPKVSITMYWMTSKLLLRSSILLYMWLKSKPPNIIILLSLKIIQSSFDAFSISLTNHQYLNKFIRIQYLRNVDAYKVFRSWVSLVIWLNFVWNLILSDGQHDCAVMYVSKVVII